MKTWFGPPRPQCMEESCIRIIRFVRMILIKEMMGRVRFLHQAIQLSAQNLYLLIVEHLDSSKISLFIKKNDLLICEPESVPLFFIPRLLEKMTDWSMHFRKIVEHLLSPHP